MGVIPQGWLGVWTAESCKSFLHSFGHPSVHSFLRLLTTLHRYVGAEDGIYEYHVNVAARKLYPSVVLR